MRLIPIASSSKGNAYVVEHDGAGILIDCGVPYRMLREYEVSAVLITHDHSDHTSGLPVFLGRREVPVYANMLTASAVAADVKVPYESFVCFENGQDFEIGPFSVHPFSIPHDASDPVGYLIRAGGECYFHGTDIGTPLDSIGVKLAEADMATLESNHDPVLLRTSARPACLKQRIAGPRGHLSNDDAADLVRRFASPRLKRLYLAHLSHECNVPRFAEETMCTALAEIGRTDISLEILA